MWTITCHFKLCTQMKFLERSQSSVTFACGEVACIKKKTCYKRPNSAPAGVFSIGRLESGWFNRPGLWIMTCCFLTQDAFPLIVFSLPRCAFLECPKKAFVNMNHSFKKAVFLACLYLTANFNKMQYESLCLKSAWKVSTLLRNGGIPSGFSSCGAGL